MQHKALSPGVNLFPLFRQCGMRLCAWSVLSPRFSALSTSRPRRSLCQIATVSWSVSTTSAEHPWMAIQPNEWRNLVPTFLWICQPTLEPVLAAS